MKTHTFISSRIAFATNHGKGEAAIDPFKRILNATVYEVAIDSDRMGTFSGEVERPGSIIDALRGKVTLARESTKERFVLVSEGSFGAGAGFGYIAQGVEMLMLHDLETNAEILEQHISLNTNYWTEELRTESELDRFLTKILFGSHAVVLYPSGTPLQGNVFKGIKTKDAAINYFTECLQRSPNRSVIGMSDMRAHLNPTRLDAIAECCDLLAKRLLESCPMCKSGGFGIVGTVPGLPCRECGSETAWARAEKHACPFCGESAVKARSDKLSTADPINCPCCNP